LQALPLFAALFADFLAGELLVGGQHATSAGTLADERRMVLLQVDTQADRLPHHPQARRSGQ
jgi:hypothetical protein